MGLERGLKRAHQRSAMAKEESWSPHQGEWPRKRECNTLSFDEKICTLKEQINHLEKIVKALATAYEAENKDVDDQERRKNEQPYVPSIDLEDGAGSSSGRTTTEDEKLRRLVNELAEDCNAVPVNYPLCRAKLDHVNQMWNDVMVEQMRIALKDTVGESTDTLDPQDVTEKTIIAAMDESGACQISLAEYKRKPVQPKRISRNVWMEHLKMAKKFADVIAHICTVHRSGDVGTLEWTTTQAALSSVEHWEDKWMNNEAMMKEIGKLIVYEIMRRVEDYEYYNCMFCNVVEYNVKQFLAHFASGTHCKKARELIDSDLRTMLFGFADKQMIDLTTIGDELHGFYSQQFTAPLVKSGAKVPQASKNSIPTVEYLDELEEKYGLAINGDIDQTKLEDAVYVAKQLPGVIKRHKSPIGKQLFKQLHEYLGKGTSLYCRRCHWKVSNRASYYAHLMNPYHVSMNYLKDGHQFNLLTVSINVHLRGEINT
ncbi:hypothetical protein PRIPAC_84932 [Pristionchus pacificus]|nr:hypothetical protein PRIPAC_84932 [Pristionchus pacificus]|eukprot:PDM69499.1 hypothetical protein PRIPAC_44595 [Pristionchus pacificus]